MHVRVAIFEGTVEAKDRPRFDAHVRDAVLPIIAGFPKIRSARCLKVAAGEDGGPPVYQIFELAFDNAEDCLAALASPGRAQSRAALAEIMPLFKGRIYHLMTSATEKKGG